MAAKAKNNQLKLIKSSAGNPSASGGNGEAATNLPVRGGLNFEVASKSKRRSKNGINPTEAEATVNSHYFSKEQIDILEHTRDRAAGGFYCGDSPEMKELVKMGLMEYAGRKPFVEHPYFCLTAKGRFFLKNR